MRADLVAWVDDHIVKLLPTCTEDEGEYICGFRCDIQVLELDLASVSGTLKFTDVMRKRYVTPLVLVLVDLSGALHCRYPYVSHLVCNAGVASFSGIDWMACIKQLVASPMSAIMAPVFNLQHTGEISADNISWV